MFRRFFASLAKDFGELSQSLAVIWRVIKSIFAFLRRCWDQIGRAILRLQEDPNSPGNSIFKRQPKEYKEPLDPVLFGFKIMGWMIVWSFGLIVVLAVFRGGSGSSSNSKRIESHEDYINASPAERRGRIRETVGDADAYEVQKGLDTVYGIE